MAPLEYLFNPNYGDFVLRLLVFVITFAVLAFVITVHEYAHAYIAFRLGDPTAKAMGRVSFDPRVHLDPLGTIFLLLTGFGWGRPVEFNPDYFSNPRRDAALVSLAGPLSNFLFASLFAIMYQLLPKELSGGALVIFLLRNLIITNLALCFFNLIPVHPLDGFKVVWGFLPRVLAEQWMDLAPYGIYLLLFLIFTNLAGAIISLPLNFFLKLFI